MESRGENIPHKCPGTPCCLLCSEGIHQIQPASSSGGHDLDRQHIRGLTHQQDGRDLVTSAGELGENSMGMVSGTSDHPSSSTPSRCLELDSRLSVPASDRQVRLDSGGAGVRNAQQSLGAARCRPFCNSVFSMPAKVLQLETRPRGGSDRCLHSAMEEYPGICTSPMVSHPMSPQEGTVGEGNGGPDCSNLEALVSIVNGITVRPASVASSGLHSPLPKLPSGRGAGPPTVGHVAGIRGQLHQREISEKASELILSSWRLKTNVVYNSAWRKWEEWCREKDVCSVAVTLSDILEFLACQFEKGKQYHSLNVYRSALSSTHLPIKGFPVPVGCLSAYLEATHSFRHQNDQLFLATVTPYSPVSSSSIAMWLKSSIKHAGMDEHFTAHSTRSAVTTAATLSGMSTQDVINQANWSKDDTFCRFNYRPSQEKIAKDFGRAVLGYKPA